MDQLQKFFRLVKVDEAQRLVYGLVTAERRDKDGETCHYASTKPEYQKVNEELGKASDGENIMPLREMHQLQAAGCGKSINFNDDAKEISIAFKVVDESAWQKVLQKVYLGFSQGGKYLKRWTEAGINYYTAQPGEVSLVDNPCLPGAMIEYIKADGSIEKFATPSLASLSEQDVERLAAALAKSVKGDPLAEIENELASLEDSELGTYLEKINTIAARLVAQITAATGARNMNPEQIKKCAAALGISEADFAKLYVPADSLEKAKKGIAALHAHMEAAVEHHEAMHKAHGEMGKMHEKMATHLGKCMKACKDVMGSDEKEAEKALKALVDELKAAPAADEAAKAAAAKAAADAASADKINKADAQKMVDDAVAKVTEELTKKFDKTPEVRVIPRDDKAIAKAATGAPIPV